MVISMLIALCMIELAISADENNSIPNMSQSSHAKNVSALETTSIVLH